MTMFVFATSNNKSEKILLTKEQLKGILMRHDKDGDLSLSKKELEKGFEELGAFFPGWRAWQGFHVADADNNGLISDKEIDSLIDFVATLKYTT